MRDYAELENKDQIIDYLNQRFGSDNWLITLNGREAIRLALAQFKLQNSDLVTILTTTGNFYISSCVTNEISNFCSWNRELNQNTNLIFVNHEFGYPYAEMQNLLQTGIPVIEDCCTTFFSQDESGMIGSYGTYSIYSFPKFFPLQIGGLLVGKHVAKQGLKSQLSDIEKQYIINVLSHTLIEHSKIIKTRSEVLKNLINRFEKLGFIPRFESMKNVVPSVFMFKSKDKKIDWDMLKKHFWKYGIQSSVFYGEEAFFIPAHQNLNEVDLDYFEFVLKVFLEERDL